MDAEFDFVVVGGGSAGAVIAARLSEDPDCSVALVEAGCAPPAEELVPAAGSSMWLNPETDWMYTADPGNGGRGMIERRMMVPRGKMLGGSSGINYLAYVRGHPADFDSWAAGGATGWSYEEVLPYFKKSEGFVATGDVVVDLDAHGVEGPLGVTVHEPVLSGAQEFVDAVVAAGIPAGDYNGRDRLAKDGVVSLFQITTRDGKRSSTYRAFLEGEAERRPNLTLICGARATRLVLESTPGGLAARGVEYSTSDGDVSTASARREVILSAGAVGSPQLLLLSGIGPRGELEALGIRCELDSPDVGKHLKDHLETILLFSAPGAGVSTSDVARSMAANAFVEARGLATTSLYEASAWYSTGLGDQHTHDAQLAFFACGDSTDGWRWGLRIDPDEYFADAGTTLAPDAENIMILANPVQPHSEGEVLLASSDPVADPDIRMGYFSDPHDLRVMVSIIRTALDVVDHWPAHRKIGPLMVPPFLATRHGHTDGDRPSDALLEDLACHYACTVFHLTSTCRIGSVVDPQLRVSGVDRLRIADASVMPNVVSGNTNAAAIMIGEKAAELIAAAHQVRLRHFVGQ